MMNRVSTASMIMEMSMEMNSLKPANVSCFSSTAFPVSRSALLPNWTIHRPLQTKATCLGKEADLNGNSLATECEAQQYAFARKLSLGRRGFGEGPIAPVVF